MPRRGRIEFAGKFEAIEAQIRADELKQLERELHREWRTAHCESDGLINAGAELASDGINDLATRSSSAIPDNACEDFQANHTDVRIMFG